MPTWIDVAPGAWRLMHDGRMWRRLLPGSPVGAFVLLLVLSCRQMTPDGTATSTSNAGQGGLIGGGWVQVAPGLPPVTETVGATQVAKQGTPIRAGALTVVQLVPTP